MAERTDQCWRFSDDDDDGARVKSKLRRFYSCKPTVCVVLSIVYEGSVVGGEV